MNALFPVLTPQFLSKIVIAIILTVFLYNLFQAVRYGRKRAELNRIICRLIDDGMSRHKADILAKHQKYAKRSFWILILGVGVVDITLHFLSEPVYDTLFWVHLLLFAVPSVIFFGSILDKYTGLKHKNVHWKFVYWGLLPTLVGTLLTGIPLLYRL